MTIEEFNAIGWGCGMKAKHKDGNVYDVVSCDFEEKLVGLKGMVSGASDDYISWVRCENIEIEEYNSDLTTSMTCRWPGN